MQNKYGIMEIKDGETVTAYVVAKCQVLSQKQYLINDKTGTIYHVVFSWNQNGENNIQPRFDQNGVCLNAVMVAQVFDNVSECRKAVENLNDQLVKDEIKKAKIYEVRELASKFRKILQEALDMQEAHLKSQSQELIK